jgi:hypothetical protein
MSRSAIVTVRFQADARPAHKQPRLMSRDKVLALVRGDDTDQTTASPETARPLLMQLLDEYAADLDGRATDLCNRQMSRRRGDAKIRNKDWVSLKDAANRARNVYYDLHLAEASGPRLMSDD